MLKKLVKYGNSNALVLDKALLELLNIAEGSVVKITTNGTSLTITPQDTGKEASITKTTTPVDSLKEASMQNMVAKFCKNPEDAQAYTNELNAALARYEQAAIKLNTSEVQQKLQEVDQRFNGDRFNPEHSKAVLAIRQQYTPELIEIEREVQLISQKYASQEYQDAYTDNAFSSSINDFKKVHEKYRHVQAELTKLNENPDYIHESVLLAEKYQATKNSPEYISEYMALITKYIPEYKSSQAELEKVSLSLQKPSNT